jgi:hypothetical protein
MPTYVVASDNLAETYKLETAPLSDSKNAIFLEGTAYI